MDRRKFVKTAGAGVALATSLAGCSGDGDGSDGGGDGGDGSDGGGQGTTAGGSGGKYSGVTLRLMSGEMSEPSSQYREFANGLKSSAKKKWDLNIEWQGVSWSEIVTKYKANQAAGDLPQGVQCNSSPVLLTSDQTIDLYSTVWQNSRTADHVAQGQLDFHFNWAKQATQQDKKQLFTWPLAEKPFFPVYRQDWLEAAGYSKEDVDHRAGTLQWNGMVQEVHQAMKESSLGQQSGNYPGVTGMKESDALYLDSLYAPQFGGTGVVNEQGTEATINSDAALEAINTQIDWIDRGLFHPDALQQGDEESTTLHWQGKTGINHLQDIGDIWQGYNNEKPNMMENGEFAFGVPWSGVEGNKKVMAWADTFMPVDSFDNTQMGLEAFADFMDLWAVDNMLDFAAITGEVPISPDVYDEPQFSDTDAKKDFFGGAVRRILEEYSMTSMPAIPAGNEIAYQIPAEMYQRILSQGEDVESAANRAAEQINSTLAEHGR